ncbi:hypothetical protein CCACVL1_21705 [Corchorus capsularis]|uniref:Uncharacterized protein n=1 Tax=Corchorus capsularis TaxID=210143 RepID=A0A1R3H2E3_COCAP|nr:hypothetical protein CCACVL1_21705 [Corchorus capsularis]
MGEGLQTSNVLLPVEMQVEKPSRNSVEVDTTSSEESGDENVEEDGVDEELNPKELKWDNDDDNGELVTSRVKLSKAIEHEEQLWNEINDVNVDADIEDNPGPENAVPENAGPETTGPATVGPARRVKSRANKGFSDFPKPRPRRKVEEVYFDSSDPDRLEDDIIKIPMKAIHVMRLVNKRLGNKQKKKRTESESSNQQSTRQESARTFSVRPNNVQVVNRGKESEYVIARPAGNVQNFTTVRKLKEDARKMRHDRAAGTSNDQKSCQP